ncbi:entericidin A/B family lipoprotein [Aquisalinus flavus]|uniref:Uncharacterized protein n=1 Tax=Aquisalinus flavus TaxID=1526572 RepID=A0A8J2Y306_9PROT|nr:entericidin A/B family lipoprotein [Aquisalinus flavus]MBD0426968.1 entericidin A/B family lipoprotein [Aquisalinus flavus]UNE46803.1 entericidin A/B family lipoprotein [Aquisalinus flavus]GGC97321.1 hypothetical protein GCM10011342_02810 [Aquisalinus flavus]
MLRILAALVALTMFMSACETVKGVGRDITNAGEAIDEAVD